MEYNNSFKSQYNKEFKFNSQNVVCLCGSSLDKLLFNYDRYEHFCPTVLCLKCGLVRSNPRINETYMANFYKSDKYRIFTTENKTQDYLNLFRISKHIYKNLKNYIKPKSKILEIGCGGGWNLLSFLRSGHKVYGTEYSSELKKISKFKGVKILNNDLNLINQKFDIIIVSHVLEHLYDINKFFFNLKKIINNNGLIYIEVPSIEKKYSLDQIQFFHNYYFTKNTLIKYCTKNRFKIFKWAHTLNIHQFVLLKKFYGFSKNYNNYDEIYKIKNLHKKYSSVFYTKYKFNFYLRKIIKTFVGKHMTNFIKIILRYLRTSFL